MANEIRIGLELTGEKKVQKGLGDTADAFDDLGEQATAAGKSSDKAGDKFKDAAKDAGQLERKLQDATKRYRELLAEFDKTGDESLLRDVNAAKRDVNRFTRLAGDQAGGAAATGASLGKALTTQIGAAGPYVQGAAAALAASAAPFLGGAIAAGVIGGVGAGGIIGGISLAAKDPEVQAAGSELAEALSSGFGAAAAPFTAPLVESLNELKGTAANAAGELAPGFAALAKTIAPLTDGVDGLVSNALPGLNKGLKAAAPLFKLAADELPELGQAIGDAVADISEDPDGAILALKAIFEMSKDVIGAIGSITAALSQAYEDSVRFGAQATGDLEDVFGWVPVIGDRLAATNDDLEGALSALDRVKGTSDDLSVSTDKLTVHTYGLGVAADGTAESLERERAAMQELVDLEIARIRGTIGVERAIDDLVAARKANGKAVGEETEAERRNSEQILDGIEAVRAGAQAEYDLARQHGATAEEAERAAKAYRDKFGKELEAQIIKLFGNTKAVQDLLAQLKKLDGQRITYTVIQKGGSTVGHKVSGGIQLAGDTPIYRRASGGPTTKGNTYWVGENGPELLTMGANGYVTNAQASKQVATAGAAPVGVQVVLSVQKSGNAPLDALLDWMLEQVRADVRTTAGGSAQEFFGVPGAATA